MTTRTLIWDNASADVEVWRAEDCHVTNSDHTDDAFSGIRRGDPMMFSGAAMISGTRVPVFLIAEMHEEGVDIATILVYYPHLTEGQVHSALAFAEIYPEVVRSDRSNYDVTVRELGGE